MYRRRNDYGPRYERGVGGRGQGRGYGVGYSPGRGVGFGPRRRFVSPFCDYYPDRPRGWWVMPEYQGEVQRAGFVAPPAEAVWDPTGKPENPEAVEYEISIIQKQMELLQEEIKNLKALNKPSK